MIDSNYRIGGQNCQLKKKGKKEREKNKEGKKKPNREVKADWKEDMDTVQSS